MYNKSIKLATVIATYNGAEWIEWCLDSLVSSESPTEIIIVDNNSTDRTKDIIKSKFPQVQLIEESQNLGFGKANNIGLKIALNLNADHIFLLNQDAKVEPNTLYRLVNSQLRSKQYGIVSPVHFNGFGTVLDNYFSHYVLSSNIDIENFEQILQNPEKADSETVYPIGFVNAAAWLLSRECVEIVGGFDPLFDHYGEDNNYLDRIRYHGFEVGIVPNSIMYHDRGQRGGNSSRNPFARKMEVFRRSILIDALNPNGANKVNRIKRGLLIRKWQSFLSFDRVNSRLQNDIYKEFVSKVDIIHEHYELSKRKDITYLE